MSYVQCHGTYFHDYIISSHFVMEVSDRVASEMLKDAAWLGANEKFQNCRGLDYEALTRYHDFLDRNKHEVYEIHNKEFVIIASTYNSYTFLYRGDFKIYMYTCSADEMKRYIFNSHLYKEYCFNTRNDIGNDDVRDALFARRCFDIQD